MRNHILYVLFGMAIALGVHGCSSFSYRVIGKELVLTEEKGVSKLAGYYAYYPSKKYYVSGDYSSEDTNSYNLIDNPVYRELVEVGSRQDHRYDLKTTDEKEYYVSISFQEETKLRLAIFEEDVIIKDTTLIGTYRGGMFYLDNNCTEIKGVPYIFGSLYHSKRRIGISNDGSLLVNVAIRSGGAALLIIGGSDGYNISYAYKKIIQ